MMLGFGHLHDQLNDSDDVKGENPFQDVRVRRAAWQANNIDAVNRVVMRGQAEPASQLMPPGLSDYSSVYDERLHYDPEAARALRQKQAKIKRWLPQVHGNRMLWRVPDRWYPVNEYLSAQAII